MDEITKLQESVDMLLGLSLKYGLSLLGAIAIFMVGRFASKKVSNILYKAMKRGKMDETLSRFLANLSKYAILAFTFVAVLSQFGIQTASLVAVLGAAGLAIGLALQGTLSHVASGVMILIFRPFKIGDYIESSSGVAGTVDAIGLFVTELNTPQNVKIIVPNGQVWDSALSNYSANKTRRADITIGIDYEDDIDLAMKTMRDILEKDERLLTTKGKELQILVTNLGDNSVDITVRAWVNTSDYWAFMFDHKKDLKEALGKVGISIPFPQRVVHMVQK